MKGMVIDGFVFLSSYNLWGNNAAGDDFMQSMAIKEYHQNRRVPGLYGTVSVMVFIFNFHRRSNIHP